VPLLDLMYAVLLRSYLKAATSSYDMVLFLMQELSVDHGGRTIDEALDALVAAEMLIKHADSHYSYAHSYLHDAAHSLLPVELQLKLNVAAAHYYEGRRAESLRILQAEMTARHARATSAPVAARPVARGQARLCARRHGAVSSASLSRMVFAAASERRRSDEESPSEHDPPARVYTDHAAGSPSGRDSVSSNAHQPATFSMSAVGTKSRRAYGAKCSESPRREETVDGKVVARALRLSLLGARAEVDEEALLLKLQHHWCAAVDAGGGHLERLRAVDYLQKVADRSLKVTPGRVRHPTLAPSRSLSPSLSPSPDPDSDSDQITGVAT
jgi:hypothetical protein